MQHAGLIALIAWQALASAVTQIGMGSQSDPAPSSTELRHLVLAEHLRHAERRAATFRVAWAIGHLIGTPLNVIAGRAALIRSATDAGVSADHARRIEEQVERLALEIRKLIDYLTPPDPASEPGSVSSVIEDALALCSPFATEQEIGIDAPAGTLPHGSVDRVSTLLVLTTLLSLAARKSPRGQTIRLRVSEAESNPSALKFELTAPGMDQPEGRIDRLEPPKDASRGTSEAMLALSICFAVAQRRGGDIRIDKDQSSATVMSFTCPLVG
jgi:signal transduction histidine kinase